MTLDETIASLSGRQRAALARLIDALDKASVAEVALRDAIRHGRRLPWARRDRTRGKLMTRESELMETWVEDGPVQHDST